MDPISQQPPPVPQKQPDRSTTTHPEAVVLVVLGVGLAALGLYRVSSLSSAFYSEDADELAVVLAPFWLLVALGLILVALAAILNAIKQR